MPLITRNIVKSSARVQSEGARDVISVRYVTHLRLLAHTNGDGWQELGLPVKLTTLICKTRERFIIYNVVYGERVHSSTRYRKSVNFLHANNRSYIYDR